MTVRAVLSLGALLVIGLAACEVQIGPATIVRGSGSVKTESRSVSGFDRVSVAGVGTLSITQGATESLTIHAEDNLLPLLRSNVQGGTLRIGPAPATQVAPTQSIGYDLTVNQLQGIEVTGAVDVRAASLNANQLALTVTGASHVDLGRVVAGSLTADVTGSGEVTVTGQAPRQTISLSGTGRYLASGLSSQQVTVEVTGAGDCEVRVSDHLSATVTGAGHISYAGSPAVDERVTGAGSVTHSG